MSKWVTIKLSDIHKPTKSRWEKHTPSKRKGIPWLICQSCGLIYLRNKATTKAVRKGHEVLYD